ncbi:hypothetical protein ACFQJD_11405 [Haloplanus sp. GCM10025708]|uniref:hypothetical protein n=1 Tax=Haloplanus sp. GCM10025708 TaxID=3252679 RepID=UPI003613D63A
MADKKFTLLELHLDEGSIQFGPSQMGDVVGKRKTEAAPTGDGDANADADESADAGGVAVPAAGPANSSPSSSSRSSSPWRRRNSSGATRRWTNSTNSTIWRSDAAVERTA